MEEQQKKWQNLTRRSVFYSSLLSEPLACLFPLLGVILYRDLGAGPFELAIFTMLRPVVAIFSLYWAAPLKFRQDLLRVNVVGAGILARLPFLFFPFVTSPIQIIICTAFYWLFYRGGMPGWMEILKLNLPKAERSRVFSKSSALAYLEGIVLALGFGMILDGQHESWRMLYPVSSLIGMLGVYFQAKTPFKEGVSKKKLSRDLSLISTLKEPWIQAYQILRKDKAFLRFQWGFMLSGFGLMILQPALPLFFVDVLKISYRDLSLALSVCKGVGYAMSSSWWGINLHKQEFHRYTSKIFILFAIYPFVLAAAGLNLSMLYLSFILYGVAQAGSHLTWHISGTLFAGEESSSSYSSVNILTVGLRGAIAPAIGGVLILGISPVWVLAIGGILSFVSFGTALFFSRLERGNQFVKSGI